MRNKVIKSQDGKITIRYNDVAEVCIVVSMFALLQYLLVQDENKEKKSTCYFVSGNFPEDIVKKLPAIRISMDEIGIKRRIKKISLYAFSRIKYPFLKKANIYAQDFCYPVPIIGKKHYTLLSDGPLSLEYFLENELFVKLIGRSKTIRGKVERFLYGDITLNINGTSKQCDRILLTEPEKAPICSVKETIVQSLQEMWNNSSESKRRFILDVFNVQDSDIYLLTSRPIMFMTQPIMKDFSFGDAEYADFLKRIFEKYNESRILLKVHPRDDFDYQKYFPNIKIFSKPINMQLLTLLGVLPQKAVTLFSSSVTSFPDNVEVDWYGVTCHPKIWACYTHPIFPSRPYNQVFIDE